MTDQIGLLVFRLMARASSNIFRGRSTSEIGAYTIADAARYLQLPVSTVRDWVVGRSYRTSKGSASSAAVIKLDDPQNTLLSFRNLIEVHVLSALRREHEVKLEAVRKAVRLLERELGSKHPLVEQEMYTSGGELFIKRYESLLNASQSFQGAMSEVLGIFLQRIDRNPAGAPIRLYPFASSRTAGVQPRIIAIDPSVRFGRPFIVGAGVPTSAVAERYKAGESIESLADDFSCEPAKIEEAVRYELHLRAAA